uniref:Uncharacterized protein n=1 Tax=Anguilla anguilla TaxID=7936 RepID=A0A0E9WWB0_ANGAN
MCYTFFSSKMHFGHLHTDCPTQTIQKQKQKKGSYSDKQSLTLKHVTFFICF